MRAVLRGAALAVSLLSIPLETSLATADLVLSTGPVLDAARLRLEAAGYGVTEVRPFGTGLLLGLEAPGCRVALAVLAPQGWDEPLFRTSVPADARLAFDTAGVRTPGRQPTVRTVLDHAAAKIATLLGRPRSAHPVYGLAVTGPCPQPPPVLG